VAQYARGYVWAAAQTGGELLGAQVLLVLKYDEELMVDRALSAGNYFGRRCWEYNQ